nr:MAG TPA: Perosamine N-acetyltransferase [Caudoviricetes sp.]
MKKYTQADFDNFEVDKFGRKICPTGDYTAMKSFGKGCDFGVLCSFDERCSFGALCSFDKGCSFGEGCSFSEVCCFGEWCSFGNGCSFSNGCSFDKGCIFSGWCRFGNGCVFGWWCTFGEECIFSEECIFGEWCTFSEWCSFGEGCIFSKGCSYENGAVKNGRYVAVDRIGSEDRKAYFYIDDNGNMFVRAGCWFSDMAAFRERVKKVHAGTIHEKTYLAACDLAELMLKGGNEDYLHMGAIPAADVAPVVHGEWIERALRPTCSLCGFSGSLIDAPISPFKYCPNCGAKMDKTGGERHD